MIKVDYCAQTAYLCGLDAKEHRFRVRAKDVTSLRETDEGCLIVVSSGAPIWTAVPYHVVEGALEQAKTSRPPHTNRCDFKPDEFATFDDAETVGRMIAEWDAEVWQEMRSFGANLVRQKLETVSTEKQR